jgi:hypothetical protein
MTNGLSPALDIIGPEPEKQSWNVYVDLVNSLSKQLARHEAAAAAARQGGIVPPSNMEIGIVMSICGNHVGHLSHADRVERSLL